MPHLAQAVLPLYALLKKGVKWDWTPTLEQAFQGVKRIIKRAQALLALDPARPCELDVHGTQGRFRWGVWQQSEQLHQPLGLWSQLRKGAEVRYSLTEKQLAAVCAALLAREAVTGTTHDGEDHLPHCRVGPRLDGQASQRDGSDVTLAKWGTYLQQKRTLSTSSLQAKLQEVLGPVTYVVEKSTAPAPTE